MLQIVVPFNSGNEAGIDEAVRRAEEANPSWKIVAKKVSIPGICSYFLSAQDVCGLKDYLSARKVEWREYDAVEKSVQNE